MPFNLWIDLNCLLSHAVIFANVYVSALFFLSSLVSGSLCPFKSLKEDAFWVSINVLPIFIQWCILKSLDTHVPSMNFRLRNWYHVTDGTVFSQAASSSPLALQRVPVEPFSRPLGPVHQEIRRRAIRLGFHHLPFDATQLQRCRAIVDVRQTTDRNRGPVVI